MPTPSSTAAAAGASQGGGPATRPREATGWRRLGGPRALALAAVVLFAGLALFGARVHWVEEAGSAERDGYAAQAERILAGELPRDPFRPAFYPLAVAAVAALGVPAFAAARLVSNLAAVALACLAWFFARRLGRAGGGSGLAAGWVAFALTAVNPNLWILGQHATTDMTFAALAAGTLAAAFAYLERPGRRSALAAGVLLGVATFTRANAMFLAPALLAAWWLGGRAGSGEGGSGAEAAVAGEVAAGSAGGAGPEPRRRLSHLLAAAGATALALVPHFALRAAAFGDPFHDENWKNLAFKLHGFPDWSYLDRVPFAGPGELLGADPGAVVTGFFSELGRFLFGGGLSQLLGTPLHALLFVAGTALALALGPTRRRAAWLLFAAATFLCAVALTFFTWGRLLLVLLPLGSALAAVPWGGAGRRWTGGLAARLPGRDRVAGRPGGGAAGAGSRRLLPAALLLAAVSLTGLLAAKTFAFRLPAFAANHPYAAVDALRRLEAATPPGTVFAGTSPFLGRYVDRPYVYVPDAFGAEVDDPDLYLRSLHARLTETGAGYLVVDPVDLRDRPAALVGDEPAADWLEGADLGGSAVVWKVVGSDGAGPRA